MNAVLGPNGRPIPSTEIARVRADANCGPDESFAFPGMPYDGGQIDGQWFGGWRQTIRSPDLEWLPYRDQAVARARDLARNDPNAAAAIARRKNSAVGKGWRLSSKPDIRALKITADAGAELAAEIESEWRQYAYGHNFAIDAERKLTFGQQLRVACHGFMADGEGCGVAEWANDEGTRYATRLRIVDPDRLSNPTGKINDAFFRSGVESNRRGQPVRYWFRQAHPADYVWTGEAFEWIGIDRFTPWGRPQVFHWFDPERAHQSRGVTRFVQALKSFRALAKFTDATLQNAAINALYVGFVQSSAGPEAVSESLSPKDLNQFNDRRSEYYGKHPIVGSDDARFAVLPMGDEVKMATAERQVTGFDAFVRAILRMIAASLGVTYEEISMDFSQTNYSSARAALIIAQAETDAMKGILEAQLVRPFFVAWLEEAFDRGYLTIPAGAPDFEDAPDAYAEARWIGPGRGYIDPVKEVLAAAARMEAGITTLDDECAERGVYWEDQMRQQARENALRKQLGLEPVGIALAQSIEDTKNPAKQAPKPSDDEGQPIEPPVDAPEDQKPPAGAPESAMSRLARIAADPAHDAALDARPLLTA
jgi:lambda family phage portal protein